MIGIIIEGNVADPVIRAGDDRLVEPVMPETPVNDIGEEVRNFHIRRHNDRMIQLIDIPSLFQSCEYGAKTFLQWIDLASPEWVAAVDQPRNIKSSQSNDCGKPRDAYIQWKRFHFMQCMLQPVTQVVEAFKGQVQRAANYG